MLDDKLSTQLYYARASQKRFVELQNELIEFFKLIMKDDPLSDDYLNEKIDKINNTENTPGNFLGLIRMLNPGAIRTFAEFINNDLREYIDFRYNSVNEKYNFFSKE